jgi:hypothetical protein
MKRRGYWFSLLLLLCLSPTLLWAAVLAGKVTVDGEAIVGIEVMAYPVTTLDFSQPAAFKTGPTTRDGLFALELPKGEYYLMAFGQGLFNYYGRNPVSVAKEGLENINLLMIPDKLPVPEVTSSVETGIVGLITAGEQPVEGAVVTVYPDLSSHLKGMGLGMSAPTDATGVFEFNVSPGAYYLVVRVRKNGAFAGPLRAGDLFGYLFGNPLQLRHGQVERVHIPVIEVPEKVERHADNLFGNTRVIGRILNARGEPIAGLQAMLYEDPMMLNRPLYVSRRTGNDGRFVLSFPKGGTYYLSARSELGGTPAPGELYGRYQGSPNHSLRVRTGKTLEDIDIFVEEVY